MSPGQGAVLIVLFILILLHCSLVVSVMLTFAKIMSKKGDNLKSPVCLSTVLLSYYTKNDRLTYYNIKFAVVVWTGNAFLYFLFLTCDVFTVMER